MKKINIKECEHQGKCYERFGSGESIPFGYCKNDSQPQEEDWKERFNKLIHDRKSVQLKITNHLKSGVKLNDGDVTGEIDFGGLKSFIEKELSRAREEGYKEGFRKGSGGHQSVTVDLSGRREERDRILAEIERMKKLALEDIIDIRYTTLSTLEAFITKIRE